MWKLSSASTATVNSLGMNILQSTNARGRTKKNNRKVCDVVRLWLSCLKVVNIFRREHECGVGYCKKCMKHHPFNDPCFMQPIIESDTRATKKFLYIFYDFETRQDTPYAQNTYLHVPNLCVLHQVCTGCIDIDDIKINCAICGVREFVFTRDSVKELLGFVTRREFVLIP